jgi:hypothetical protein
VAGIAVATLGILLLVSRGDIASLGWLRSTGDWLVLASAHTWAVYTVVTRDLAGAVTRWQSPSASCSRRPPERGRCATHRGSGQVGDDEAGWTGRCWRRDPSPTRAPSSVQGAMTGKRFAP